jgi:hypothetical protein
LAFPGEPAFSEGEKTRYGRIILPDVSDGMGPLYVAALRKNADAAAGAEPAFTAGAKYAI